jgi:hypothetical protein
MSDEWNCGYDELAVGWALHALEPADEAAFVGHMRTCARCQATVRSTEDVGAVLGGAVPLEEPPARLRGSLLAMIDETDQNAPPRPAAGPVQPFEPAGPVETNVVPLVRKSRMPRILTAAAAVVFVLIVTVLGVRVGQLTTERDQLSGQVSAAAGQSVQLQRAMAAVGDPRAHKTVLTTNQGNPAAILVSGKQNATVVALQLKPNDTGHVYVVWGMSAARPIALATFDVGAGTDSARALSWGPDAAKHTGFAVSLEPGRTAPAAPTDVVATGLETT